MIPISLPPSSQRFSRSFGTQLLQTFKESGYAYIRNDDKNTQQQSSVLSTSSNNNIDRDPYYLLNNLSLVRKVSRKLMEQHFPSSESRRTDAVDSLRGFYNFQAASGRADDIRCFSVGHPEKTLAELRGEHFYDADADSHTSDLLIGQKRNVWPSKLDPEERKVLEDYYRMCSRIATVCASSIEVAMKDDDDSDVDGDCSATTNWENWMSKQDNHLECKWYAGVGEENTIRRHQNEMKEDNNGTTASTSIKEKQKTKIDGSGRIQMLSKKSKILRRKKPSSTTTSSSSADVTPSNNNDLFEQRRREKEQEKEKGILSSLNNTKLFETRMDVHADLSVVTLLLQDRLGGLEVFDYHEKQFVTVPLRGGKDGDDNDENDALLVHAGMFLEKWSNGEIIATPHRVRTVENAPDRCSVVFFAFPNFDARIEVRGEEERKSYFIAGDEHPKV